MTAYARGGGWVKSLELQPVTPTREVTRTRRQLSESRSVLSVETEITSAPQDRIPPAVAIILDKLRDSHISATIEARPRVEQSGPAGALNTEPGLGPSRTNLLNP